jgi:hypothetical protein
MNVVSEQFGSVYGRLPVAARLEELGIATSAEAVARA